MIIGTQGFLDVIFTSHTKDVIMRPFIKEWVMHYPPLYKRVGNVPSDKKIDCLLKEKSLLKYS